MESEPEIYHKKLRRIMDEYVHKVYDCTSTFPREELFGITSQFRRSSLSIILNYIEGYARQKSKVHKNFLEISYGSLKESSYLAEFSFKRKHISETVYNELLLLADNIGKMLWGIISKIK